MSVDLTELIERIFSQPPQAPHQCSLELDHTGLSSYDVFRTLGQILTHGAVYLYGEDADVSQFTQKEQQTMESYMQSIGWSMVLNPKQLSDYPQALPWILRLPMPRGQFEYFLNIIFEPYVG